jgi:hypothetical protein
MGVPGATKNLKYPNIATAGVDCVRNAGDVMYDDDKVREGASTKLCLVLDPAVTIK